MKYPSPPSISSFLLTLILPKQRPPVLRRSFELLWKRDREPHLKPCMFTWQSIHCRQSAIEQENHETKTDQQGKHTYCRLPLTKSSTVCSFFPRQARRPWKVTPQSVPVLGDVLFSLSRDLMITRPVSEGVSIDPATEQTPFRGPICLTPSMEVPVGFKSK